MARHAAVRSAAIAVLPSVALSFGSGVVVTTAGPDR